MYDVLRWRATVRRARGWRMTGRGDDGADGPDVRPFPVARAAATVVVGFVLIAGTLTDSRAPARAAVLALAAELLTVALMAWTWRTVRGALPRGVLLAATGSGAAAVLFYLFAGTDAISRAVGVVTSGFFNALVWAAGGTVGSGPVSPAEPAAAPVPVPVPGPVRPRPPARVLAGWLLTGVAALAVAIPLVVAFDRAYLAAYTTKRLEGLAGWGVTSPEQVRRDALNNILAHHVATVGAVLLLAHAARAGKSGKAGTVTGLAVVFALLFGLFALNATGHMLSKIGQPEPPPPPATGHALAPEVREGRE